MVDSWTILYEALIGVLTLDNVVKELFPQVSELTALKNPIAKRKLGNRLVLSLALKVGEAGF